MMSVIAERYVTVASEQPEQSYLLVAERPVDSRRPVKDMYSGPAQLTKEVTNGFVPSIQVGSLGLTRIKG